MKTVRPHPSPQSVLLIGGTSRIATLILEKLIARGDDVMVLTGRPWTPPDGVEHALIELSQYDGSHTHHWKRNYDRIISLVPIQLSVNALPYLNADTQMRAVFLSSNNAALLRNNRDYDPLRKAEETVLKCLPTAVILQPTTISGRPDDPVIGAMIKKILAGQTLYIPGLETRQHPIDYRDVARAVLHAVDHHIPSGRYSICGPEALTYAEMLPVLETALWRPVTASDLSPRLARFLGLFGVSRHSTALRRAGIHRDPVHEPLPDFVPEYRFIDMVRALTEAERLPS